MPNDLATLPSHRSVFIDANIFIYHFTQSPLTTACTAFLQRVEDGEVRGLTSVVTLTEVAHRLMLLEAIHVFHLPSRTAVRTLKEHPELVQQLSQYKTATEKIPAFNVAIEPITPGHLRAAQTLSTTYGVLTNDSLIAAVMQELALTELASNDPDLSCLPHLTLWQPQPSTIAPST